jgi:hypothetical protein
MDGFLDEALSTVFGTPTQLADGIVQYGKGPMPLKIEEAPAGDVPAGLRTTGGRKRVEAARSELDKATRAVAELAKEMMRSVGELPVTLTDDDASDLVLALEYREDSLEEFQNAMAGRP